MDRVLITYGKERWVGWKIHVFNWLHDHDLVPSFDPVEKLENAVRITPDQYKTLREEQSNVAIEWYRYYEVEAFATSDPEILYILRAKASPPMVAVPHQLLRLHGGQEVIVDPGEHTAQQCQER